MLWLSRILHTELSVVNTQFTEKQLDDFKCTFLSDPEVINRSVLQIRHSWAKLQTHIHGQWLDHTNISN